MNRSIDVIWEIQKIGLAASDPRMDGWNCFGNKQKLYQILWETQRQLSRSPKFSCEEEWLEEQAQDRMIDQLSR